MCRWLQLAGVTAAVLLGAACGSGAGGATGGNSVSGGATGTGGLASGRGGNGGAAVSTGGNPGTGGNTNGGAIGAGGNGGDGKGAAGADSGTGGSGPGGLGGRDGGSAGGPPDAGIADARNDFGRDASGSGDASTTSAYNPCPPSGTDCTIMPFGDSITDGFTVRGGYRIPFFSRARMEGKQFTFVGSAVNGPATVDGVPFPQHHEGHSAFTINNEPSVPRNGIAPLVPRVIPMFHPDIVLLMIGTNDVDNSLDLPNVPNRLGALIDSIIALDSHTLVVVAQITPTMQDPLNLRIQTYNAGIPAVVKARADAGKHVALVDMFTAFVQDPNYKSKYLADRLHPNAAGYLIMSNVWNTVVHDLLR